MENKQSISNTSVIFLIIIIGIIMYFRVMHFSFINWDDNFYVFDNPYIKQFTLSNIHYIFTHYYFDGTFQPLQLLTYMLIYQIDKLNPAWFHIINAGIFIADAILVYFFVKRINTPLIALLTALLFLLSPVNVDSASWVAELKNTQSLLFTLITLITYDNFIITGKYKWYAISMLMFIIALLTKQTVATIVVIMLFLEWFVHKKPFAKTFFNQMLFYIIAGIATPVFVIGQLRMSVKGGAFIEPAFIYRAITVIANIAGVLEYPNKLIFPFNVASFYPPFYILSIFSPRFLISVIALIVFIWLAIILYKKRSKGFFWLVWYFANMIPAFGIMHVPFYTNWYLFLPSIGLYALISMWIEHLYNYPNLKPYAAGMTVVILLVFSVISWQRINTYKDDLHLWRDGIKRFPKYYFAYEMYARALIDKGEISEAVKYAEMSLKYNPYNSKVLSGLGLYYMGKKDYNKALVYLKDALKYDPGNASYMYLLATYYKQTGDNKQYEEELRKCALRDPYEISYVNELIQFYVNNNHTEKAIQLVKEIIAMHPDNAMFYNILGYVYLKYTNNTYEAKKMFETSLSISPQQKEADEIKRIILQLSR
ncbi:MAG: tetratricopeptide repeat protein [bacterium]